MKAYTKVSNKVDNLNSCLMNSTSQRRLILEKEILTKRGSDKLIDKKCKNMNIFVSPVVSFFLEKLFIDQTNSFSPVILFKAISIADALFLND